MTDAVCSVEKAVFSRLSSTAARWVKYPPAPASTASVTAAVKLKSPPETAASAVVILAANATVTDHTGRLANLPTLHSKSLMVHTANSAAK